MSEHIGDLLVRINKARDLRPVVVREKYAESGRLPDEIEELISNKNYRNRHRYLRRLYGDRILLKVAELCHGKDGEGKKINIPAAYYARMTSLKKWDQTLATVKKLLAMTERAVVVMEKLGASQQWLHWYVGLMYRYSEATIALWVERALASKRGSPERLFAWLASGGSRTSQSG